jgi:hypothetical protein
VVADLLKAQGDIYAEQADPETSRRRYLRALALYLEGVLADLPEAGGGTVAKVEELLRLVLGAELDPETRFSLFQYHEQAGAYRRAEAALNGLLALTGLEDELRPEFVEFYERMLERSDPELAEAGMERPEMQAKLRNWQAG